MIMELMISVTMSSLLVIAKFAIKICIYDINQVISLTCVKCSSGNRRLFVMLNTD